MTMIRRLSARRTVAALGSLAVLGGATTAVAATTHTTTRQGTASTSQTASGDRLGPPGGPLATLSAGERTALAAAQSAIAAKAASIATPILDAAVSAGTITAAQETAGLDHLSKAPPTPGTRPSGPPPTPPAERAGAIPSAAARAVFDQVRSAIAEQADSIATPVLDAAVSAGTITSAQESALLTLLQHGPDRGPGHGPGGPGGPGGPMPGAPATASQAA